jgi:uncharacterized protein (TIGR03663 family)
MIRHSLFPVIVVAVMAFSIRLISLDLRPMHTDEAVHAIKFGKLLEEGYYRYDPNEYHGPTLNYLTLLPAWLFSQEKITEVNEFTLRSVPAFLGAGLVILLLLVRRYMHRSTWILSASFLSLSPVMVYYSRYYIQEILLVFFLYGFLFCVYRWKDTPTLQWAFWSGLFGGMMVATKETWILSAGVLVITLVLLRMFSQDYRIRHSSKKGLVTGSLGIMVFGAILIAVAFYSSFFSNPEGILDSMITFTHYFEKAGDYNLHIHPWFYYLQRLIFNRDGGMIWTEIPVLLGGLAGIIFALKYQPDLESRFFLFMALFSILSGIIFSAMPYKTPWNLLSFYTGWTLVAGYGFSRILRAARSKIMKGMIYLLLILIFIQLGYQTYSLNFIHYADPSNPWTYGHTTKDIYKIVEKVNAVARSQPSGEKVRIDIIATDHDYWPLPWYFRNYPNTGWSDHVEQDHPAAPLIIASPEFRPDLMKMIYEAPPPGQRHLYLPLFDTLPQLRPQVILEGYIRKDFWDNWRQESGHGN